VIDNSNREAIKLVVDKILHEMHNILGKQRTLHNSKNTTTNTLLVQGGQRDGHSGNLPHYCELLYCVIM